MNIIIILINMSAQKTTSNESYMCVQGTTINNVLYS